MIRLNQAKYRQFYQLNRVFDRYLECVKSYYVQYENEGLEFFQLQQSHEDHDQRQLNDHFQKAEKELDENDHHDQRYHQYKFRFLSTPNHSPLREAKP